MNLSECSQLVYVHLDVSYLSDLGVSVYLSLSLCVCMCVCASGVCLSEWPGCVCVHAHLYLSVHLSVSDSGMCVCACLGVTRYASVCTGRCAHTCLGVRFAYLLVSLCLGSHLHLDTFPSGICAPVPVRVCMVSVRVGAPPG